MDPDSLFVRYITVDANSSSAQEDSLTVFLDLITLFIHQVKIVTMKIFTIQIEQSDFLPVYMYIYICSMYIYIYVHTVNTPI